MKITVLGGSPKGDVSVTMQYVTFLKINFPEHEFKVCQPAHEIVLLEKNRERWDSLMDDVRTADLVLWAFPLYVFTVCGQYQRFIELISERGCQDIFHGKTAASLSTSIKFFDHIAHIHIHGICEDLGMRFAGSFSAHMQDLYDSGMRQQLLLFWEDVISKTGSGYIPQKSFPVLPDQGMVYEPGPENIRKIRTDKKITVVVDEMSGNSRKMATRFMSSFSEKPRLIEISKLDMKGGCLGCLKCGQDNICSYTGKDDYISTYENLIKKADVIVYFLSMKGRSLSSLWKTFLDRSFYNTHQRTLHGKQLAFCVSGPLSFASNIREVLTAYSEWQNSNLAGILSDEHPESLDSDIDHLALTIIKFAEENAKRPSTFLGVAGMKVFRDDIYGTLKVVFKADHRAYVRTKVYDFPQSKPLFQLIVNILYLVTKIPFIYRKISANFKEFMLMPYKKVSTMKIRGEKKDCAKVAFSSPIRIPYQGSL